MIKSIGKAETQDPPPYVITEIGRRASNLTEMQKTVRITTGMQLNHIDASTMHRALAIMLRWTQDHGVRGDALTSPDAVKTYLKATLAARDHEIFVVIYLDNAHRVIEIEELFRGTLTQTSVYPREVVKGALARNAAAVILAHNHPSGIPEPSHADEAITQALKQALALVDIRVLDHIIVGGDTCVSFAERGLL